MLNCPHCNGELVERVDEFIELTGEKIYDCQFCSKEVTEYEILGVSVPDKVLVANPNKCDNCGSETEVKNGNYICKTCGRAVPIAVKLSDANKFKFDEDKLEMHLIPKKVLRECIRVLMHGKKKYGEGSWKKVDNPKIRYLDAAQRHIDDHVDAHLDESTSAKFDDDTGLYHLAHAITCLIFVLWFEMTEHKNRLYNCTKDK
jgi:ribosomal protein L37AE/L43A